MASAKDIKANARPPKMGGRKGIVMGEKPKDFKGSMKRLLKFISPFKWKIILVMVLIVASTVLSVINPKVLAMATDTLADGVKDIAAGTGGIDFDRILQIVFYCILLYGASSIFNYLQGFIIAGVSTKIAYNLRTSIMQKIDRLPVSYFNRVSYGDVLSRITNDVDTINMNLNQTLSQAISAVITLLGVLVMMLTISWRLTLVVLITLPMSAGVMAFVMKKSQKHFFRHQKILGSVNGQVEEMYGGHVAVKAFNGEEDAVASFNEDNEKLYEAAWKSNFISGLMHPFMTDRKSVV